MKQKTGSNNVKGIIFDAEDVIYYRDDETLKPITGFFKKRGFNVSFSDFREAYEKYKLELYKGKISKDEHLRKVLQGLNVSVDPQFFEEFASIFRKTYSVIKVNEGVKNLFESLKQKGVKIGILTDTFASEQKKWEWFKSIGLDSFIGAIICSSETGFTKDTKEAFEIALKKLNLNPNDVFFVGHQKYEMDGARKAGVKSISIVKGVGEDIYVDDIQKIKYIIA